MTSTICFTISKYLLYEKDWLFIDNDDIIEIIIIKHTHTTERIRERQYQFHHNINDGLIHHLFSLIRPEQSSKKIRNQRIGLYYYITILLY